VPKEVSKAAVRSEAIRQNPELGGGDAQRQVVMRGLLVACAVVTGKAGEVGVGRRWQRCGKRCAVWAGRPVVWRVSTAY
jgi:hypothetical protein